MPCATLFSNPAKYVENEFNRIVTASNVRRMIFFDKNGTETSLKDRSSYAKDATLSLSANSLDAETAGKARVLNFNASGDFWDFSDSDELSFGDGSTNSAFSIVVCINPNSMINMFFLSKYTETTGKEYTLYTNSTSRIILTLYDNSTGGRIGRYYNTSLSSDIGKYNTYISTYSGETSSSSIKLYRNASKIDDTNNSFGTYVAMENLNAKLGTYYTDTGVKNGIASAKYAFIAIVASELTQTQITSIDTLLRKYVGAI